VVRDVDEAAVALQREPGGVGHRPGRRDVETDSRADLVKDLLVGQLDDLPLLVKHDPAALFVRIALDVGMLRQCEPVLLLVEVHGRAGRGREQERDKAGGAAVGGSRFAQPARAVQVERER